MEQLPTAEEFLQQEQFYAVTSGDEYEIAQAMIEFAKLHVQAALESASKNGRTRTNDESTSIIVDSDTILNAYPLDNIK